MNARTTANTATKQAPNVGTPTATPVVKVLQMPLVLNSTSGRCYSERVLIQG